MAHLFGIGPLDQGSQCEAPICWLHSGRSGIVEILSYHVLLCQGVSFGENVSLPLPICLSVVLFILLFSQFSGSFEGINPNVGCICCVDGKKQVTGSSYADILNCFQISGFSILRCCFFNASLYLFLSLICTFLHRFFLSCLGKYTWLKFCCGLFREFLKMLKTGRY